MHGNRGDLHIPDGRWSGRKWANKAWICCSLSRPGGGRAIFDRKGHYLPLFFLDEATAFAAGHRPCAFCRRADYNRFRQAWLEAGLGSNSARAMDQVLHAARLDGRSQRRHRATLAGLPPGTMVIHPEQPGEALLVAPKGLLPWSRGGYGMPVRLDPVSMIDVLTPEPLVSVLAQGYAPLLHPSAG